MVRKARDGKETSETKSTETPKKDNVTTSEPLHEHTTPRPQQNYIMEMLIVADYKMVLYHEDDDVKTYILTIMNMVKTFIIKIKRKIVELINYDKIMLHYISKTFIL